MIYEISDPAIVNGFANHPSIRPHLAGGDKEIDLAAGVCAPNVFFFGEHGGICLTWSAPGVFEAHVMFTIGGKGRWAVEAGRAVIAEMELRGARQIWARIHPARKEIAVFARAAGLKDTGDTHCLDAGDGPVNWKLYEWRAECRQ